jgi:hypothetical protein
MRKVTRTSIFVGKNTALTAKVMHHSEINRVPHNQRVFMPLSRGNPKVKQAALIIAPLISLLLILPDQME